MNMTAALKSKEIFNAIGQRIRKHRQSKELSLNDLAQKSGFAKSYLSQIENLKREPSISALSQIAHVLEVDLLYLLSGEIEKPITKSLTLVKKGERKTTRRPVEVGGYRYDAITYKKPDRIMEGYIVTIGHEFPSKPFVHEGQEMVYVLEGSFEMVYDGETYLLEEGDCLYFDSIKPHAFRSLGKTSSKVLAVFTARKY